MPDRALDRTAVRKIKLGEEGSDVAYWRSRPPGERLAMIEELRREYHGGSLPTMERTVTAVRTLGEERSNDDLADRTPAERIGMVWPLTRSAWAFKEAGERSRAEDGTDEPRNEPPDAQSRLPRHLVRFRRRGS